MTKQVVQQIQFVFISLSTLPFLVACGGFSSGFGLRSALSLETRNDLAASQQAAMGDLIAHYWTGDANSGHITPTWNGYISSGVASAASAPASAVSSVQSWESGAHRGGQWDRSTMVNVLYSDWLVNGTADSAARLATDWNYVKSQYSQSELVNCNNTTSSVAFASDDAGWEAQAFVHVAQVTGDSAALENAREMIRCTYSFYATGDQQHGIGYNSSLHSSGMYEVGLAIAAWDVFSLTGETEFKNYAMQSYSWMQASLFRADGLYYMGYNTDSDTVQGTNTPDQFTEGYSVSYLAGNMGMAVLNMRIYNLTGDDSYRQLALQTVQGLTTKMLNANGTFINDRDAWTNGAHVIPFAREVASQTPAGSKINVAIKKTASVILTTSRTSDGYYSADWDGATSWTTAGHNSSGDGMALPQQLYTSTQAVDFLIAAAVVANTSAVIGTIDSVNATQVAGWTCAMGSTKNLRVDFYVGGPYAQGGTMIGSATANLASETAVATACGTSGANYRYSFTLTDDIQANYAGQRIYAYGIALSGGSNLLLSNSGMFTVPAVATAAPRAPASVSSSSTADASAISTSSQAAADAQAATQAANVAAAQAAAATAAANQAAVAQANAVAQAAAQAAAQASADASAQQAAAQAAANAQAAEAQAFAAREKVMIYRYVSAKGYHFFAREGATIPKGYNLEGPVFTVYNAQYASTSPVYRCNANGHQFLSNDSACEGQNVGGFVGYVSSIPVAGSALLMRFQNNGDYIEATDTSVEGAGYALEGPLGYAP